ncbi:MAG: acyl-[Lachnospiraceae bacterium]|nr:acyl-[acyl-carrier-protein] thioesterase [Lachnospiraceae bacterium]
MYTFDSRIRYSEVDEKEHLTLTALLDYFQDCSTFQSDDSGVGMDYLRKMHMAWVLNSWQIDVTRFPKEGERVTIGTIPYTLRGPLGYRNFFMNDAEGNRLAAAQTIWTLLDMEEGIPVNAPQEVIDAYPIGEKLDMEYLPRKIRPAGEGKEQEAIQVMKHHLDANHHVNNGQYVRMAMELIPEGKMPWRLRAEYKAQARLGDTMYPVLYSSENVHTVSLNDAEGNPYAIVEFTL